MSYQHDKYEIESGLEASFSDYVEQRDLKEEGDESSAAHSPDPSVNRLHNGAVASEPTSTDAPLSVGSRGSLRYAKSNTFVEAPAEMYCSPRKFFFPQVSITFCEPQSECFFWKRRK